MSGTAASGRHGPDAPDSVLDQVAAHWRTIALALTALLVALVLAAMVVTLGEASRQRDRALALQRHSYDVMILARTLQGSIARSEASLGRYVISGDRSLGQLYYEDWRRADEAIARLALLTRDNAPQVALIARLRAAYDARGRELAATAVNTNYGRNNQALSRYYQARKAASLATINTTLEDVIAVERALLEQRTSRAMTLVQRSTRAAMVLAVFGLLLALGAAALGWAMMRALADRAVARAEAEAERERADALAQAVAVATAELRETESRLRQVEKMEAVGQLTGGIAHDFNNMLAVVMGGLQLARRHLPARGSDTALRHIDSAEEGAVRAAALTKRLLAFAREAAINPERIGAAALFAGMADLLDRALDDGVTLTLTDDSGDWVTHVDRIQLENTLLNLAVNARDAMDGRGTLLIAATRAIVPAGEECAAGEYLALHVTDTGCGMAPDVLARVFEPFFTTKPVGKGTGLGLSQIFGFARQVGGDVRVRSVIGEGTTVTLLLPRDVSTAAPVAVPAPVVSDQLSDADGPLAILLVEDDPRVLAATMEALEELGHAPVACDDPGHAAATLGRMARADLIVSDVLMPGMTGPEMVATLPVAFAAIPVLYVTGFAGEAGTAVDLGGRPVLRKPYTLAGLDAAVLAAAGGVRAGHAMAAE